MFSTKVLNSFSNVLVPPALSPALFTISAIPQLRLFLRIDSIVTDEEYLPSAFDRSRVSLWPHGHGAVTFCIVFEKV